MSSQKVARGGPTGISETAGAGRSPVLPNSVSQHCWPNHAGVGLPEAGRAAPAAGRCTEHPDRPHRRCRTRATHGVRRRSPNAGARQNRHGRHFLQPVPHHGHVLADSSLPPDRAQSPSCRGWTDRGDGERLGRVLRGDAQELCNRRGGASPLRLHHCGLGQMAQHAFRTNNGGGSLRSLADWLRLRLLLRLSLRRSVALRAQPGS